MDSSADGLRRASGAGRLLALWLLAAVPLSARGLHGAPGAAQQDSTPLPVRVVQSSPGGLLEIDRGAADGVSVGDRVLLMPRGGGTLEGRVIEVQERSAGVEMLGSTAAVAVGTRGEVWLPAAAAPRPPTEQPEATPEAPAAPAGEQAGEGAPPAAAKPAWKRIDEWREGQPLLSGLERIAPSDRPRSLRGRVWVGVDQIVTDLDGRGDGFYRLGSSLWIDNPFGQGGSFEWQGDASYRRTLLPDQDDDELGLLRVERLAYRLGGTRQEPDAYAVGRFLQHVPALGLLDGAEWVRRSPGGDRYGASLGFLPQPDPQLESAEDLALSGFYEWNQDESEELSARIAYQKTFHNWSADRDLVVLEGRYLPRRGWKAFLTSLIDLYSSGDELKSGVELTQARLSVWRDFSHQGVRFTAYSQRFPQIDGDLVPVLSLVQLADQRTERASIDLWTDLFPHARLLAGGGGWIDEEDDGADANVGLELQDLWSERDRLQLGAFLTQGKFTDVLGWRAALDQPLAGGQARVAYEYAWQDIVGFLDENDDLPQQRLSLSQDWFTAEGWSLTMRADWVLFDDDQGLWLGFFVQKTF
jgi:hypothetical protein